MNINEFIKKLEQYTYYVLLLVCILFYAKKENSMKNERGITLLVLAVTIIVMFILIGTVAYMGLDSDQGVINEVREETNMQQNLVEKEKEKMNTVLKRQEEEWGIG